MKILDPNFDELIIPPLGLRFINYQKRISNFDRNELSNEEIHFYHNISSFNKINYLLKKSYNMKCEIIINESYVDCDSITYPINTIYLLKISLNQMNSIFKIYRNNKYLDILDEFNKRKLYINLNYFEFLKSNKMKTKY